MIKWEYRLATFEYRNIAKVDYFNMPEDIGPSLQLIGDDGWEAVSANSDGKALIVLFKRPKPAQT